MASRRTVTSSLLVLLAIGLLLVVGPRLTMTQLINRFRSHDAATTARAAATLGKMGALAVSPLIEGLKDNDEYVRVSCLGVLQKIGSPRSVGPIADLLDDKDTELAQQAATALGDMGPSAVNIVAERLHSPDQATRLGAVKVLGEMLDKLSSKYAAVRTAAAAAIESAANNGDGAMKGAAISALGLALKIEARPVHTCASCPVYVGDGPDYHYQPITLFGYSGGGMSSIIMMDNHAYLAGETKATADRMLLVFSLRAKNVAALDGQDFQPLDVGIDGGEFGALGEGEVPFAKEDKDWEQLRSTPEQLAPGGQSKDYIYVFNVPKDSASWELTYKARPVARTGAHGGGWVPIIDQQQAQVDHHRSQVGEQEQQVSSTEYHAVHILIGPDKEKKRAEAAAKAAGHPLPANFNADDAAKKRAEDLLTQLSKGADFATLAKAASDDPGSGTKGGDLGWFRAEQMVPEFGNAVKALKPGEVSGVVKSEYGYHIIKLLETRAQR